MVILQLLCVWLGLGNILNFIDSDSAYQFQFLSSLCLNPVMVKKKKVKYVDNNSVLSVLNIILDIHKANGSSGPTFTVFRC